MDIKLVQLTHNLLRAVCAFLQQLVADHVDQAVLRDLQKRRKPVGGKFAGLAVGLVEDVLLLHNECGGVTGSGQFVELLLRRSGEVEAAGIAMSR